MDIGAVQSDGALDIGAVQAEADTQSPVPVIMMQTNQYNGGTNEAD